jgi:16S rRNA C967 or C1407 C5-methylase (RsmB/RsmF family)
MSSLYLGSAAVLLQFLQEKSPLTQLVYASRSLPDKQRKAAYALTLGVLRYKHVLDRVLEESGFMKLDRNMNRAIVLVMLYDLLIGETKTIVGGGGVKKALMSQENKLRTTFVRMKIAAGVKEDEELLPREIRFTAQLPRYARVNTLRSTVSSVSSVLTSEGFEARKERFEHGKITWLPGSEKMFYIDAHIPHLLVFSPGTDLHDHFLVRSGQLILQDKASCMTAAALDPQPGDAPMIHMLDACAAPGNKTTHLLAIAMEHLRKQRKESMVEVKANATAANAAAPIPATSASSSSSSSHPLPPKRSRPSAEDDENDSSILSSSNRATGQRVTFSIGGAGLSGVNPMIKLEACEVDPTRFQLLQKMMLRALPQAKNVQGNLSKTAQPPEPIESLPPVAPSLVTLRNQSFLDLSPSSLEFQSVRVILLDPTCSGSGMGHRIEQFYKHRVMEVKVEGGKKVQRDAGLMTRTLAPGHEKPDVMANVSALADFQKSILSHALSFPNVEMVCYSTCSIHAAEDECVVEAVLEKYPEFELASALPTWCRRGEKGETDLSEAQAKKLVRSAGAEDGMNGFFVAKFVRKTKGATAPSSSGQLKSPSAKSAAGSASTSQLKSSVSTAAASSCSSPKTAGQKRARKEDADLDDDADADEEVDEASMTDDAAALGKQTLRNKKKREKAKAKKRKLMDAQAGGAQSN